MATTYFVVARGLSAGTLAASCNSNDVCTNAASLSRRVCRVGVVATATVDNTILLIVLYGFFIGNGCLTLKIMGRLGMYTCTFATYFSNGLLTVYRGLRGLVVTFTLGNYFGQTSVTIWPHTFSVNGGLVGSTSGLILVLR